MILPHTYFTFSHNCPAAPASSFSSPKDEAFDAIWTSSNVRRVRLLAWCLAVALKAWEYPTCVRSWTKSLQAYIHATSRLVLNSDPPSRRVFAHLWINSLHKPKSTRILFLSKSQSVQRLRTTGTSIQSKAPLCSRGTEMQPNSQQASAPYLSLQARSALRPCATPILL